MFSGSCHCGQLRWRFAGAAESATACNCTICRRYGALWIYGWEGPEVEITGASAIYARGRAIDYHFCPRCGCVAHYRATWEEEPGLRKVAFNIRLIDDPATVADLLIDHFDGFDSFDDLPRDGRRVRDLWF